MLQNNRSILIVLTIILLALITAGIWQLNLKQDVQTIPAQPQTTPSEDETVTPTNQIPETQDNSVLIKNLSFDPGSITINVGDSVTWQNSDTSDHTVTFADFDSGVIGPDKKFTYTFNSKGTFQYRCSIHPNINGEIIVE